jgi:hypothetical protein
MKCKNVNECFLAEKICKSISVCCLQWLEEREREREWEKEREYNFTISFLYAVYTHQLLCIFYLLTKKRLLNIVEVKHRYRMATTKDYLIYRKKKKICKSELDFGKFWRHSINLWKFHHWYLQFKTPSLLKKASCALYFMQYEKENRQNANG